MSLRRRAPKGRRRVALKRRPRWLSDASASVVAQAKRMMAARRATSGELKFHDIALDDSVIALAGGITPSLNLIAQGVTESTRVGRKCTLLSLGWKFQMQLPAIDGTGAAPLAEVVRVLLYLDKQCNGAAAAVTDLWEAANFQSFNNLANSGRFRTLMDRTYSLNYQSGSGSGGAADNDYPSVVVTDDFYTKLNLPIEFTAGTGAITEIRSNNLGVLLISQNGTAAFFSHLRLRFSDG